MRKVQRRLDITALDLEQKAALIHLIIVKPLRFPPEEDSDFIVYGSITTPRRPLFNRQYYPAPLSLSPGRSHDNSLVPYRLFNDIMDLCGVKYIMGIAGKPSPLFRHLRRRLNEAKVSEPHVLYSACGCADITRFPGVDTDKKYVLFPCIHVELNNVNGPSSVIE